MCGGPSNAQNKAVSSQGKLSDTLNNALMENLPLTNKFYSGEMQNGLGLTPEVAQAQTAQAYAPARAQLNMRLNNSGNLPSGFATQARTDLDANQARASQNNILQTLLLNQQAKQQGASGLNPLGFAQAAQSGYGSIMQMPYQQSPLGSIVGGAVGGLMAA